MSLVSSDYDNVQFEILKRLYKHLAAAYDTARSELRQRYGSRLVFAHEITRCPRKGDFEKEFPEFSVAARLRPAILLGELVHMGLSRLLDPAESKCKPAGQYIVCGSADAMIGGFPAEIKYQRQAPGSPKDHHLDRIKIYMWLYDSPKGYLVYVTPENIATYIITTAFTESEIVRKIEMRVFPRYSWECKLCEYEGICEYAARKREEE